MKGKTLFLVAICFLLASPVLADPLPVAINPTRLEFTASPGEHVTSAFKLWNGTDYDLPIHLQTVDVGPQDEEGHAAVEGESAANSLKSWVTPEYPDLNVASRQEITLPFSLDVPANADPGSHWGALVAITAPVAGGSGAAVQVRTGVILLVRVLGDVKEKLTLDSFTVPRFAESPPIALEVRFRNEGTVHEAPSGDIEMGNMFGWLVATGTLPVRNVLPGAVRKVEASVGDGLWFGRYTVLISATYGDSRQELLARKIIWVLPWRTQGWKVLVGIGVLAFVIWKRRNFGAAWYFLRTGLPPSKHS